MSPFLFIPAPFPVSSSTLPTFSYLPTNSFSVFPPQLTAGLHVPAFQTPSATNASYFLNYWHLSFLSFVSLSRSIWLGKFILFFSPPLLSSSCDRPPVFSHINHLETFFQGCPDELEAPLPLPPRRHAPPGRRPSLASPALG